MDYRPHLDGIRAIAVSAVVLYHANVPGVTGGFVGVDVFFVISGYLITGLLLKELEQTGDISLWQFVERRVRRLAPALFVVVLATLLAGLALLSPIGGELQGAAKSAMATALLSANHYFYLHSGNYFEPPPYVLPLLHTWSLSVEEQYYLAWPAMLLGTAWVARRARVSLPQATWWMAGAIALLSLGACIWATNRDRPMAFYLTPFRAWEFAAGALALIALRRPAPTPMASESIAWIGLLGVVTSAVFFSHDMAFPGWLALLPVLGTCALIYGSERRPQGIAGRLLSLPPLVGLGLLSYSLYLWHWPVFSFARSITLGYMEPVMGFALGLFSLCLAWLTYRFVEQPVRSRRWPVMATRARAFGWGAASIAAVVVAGIGVGAWGKWVWPGLPGNAARAELVNSTRRPDWDCASNRRVVRQGIEDVGCLTQASGSPTIVLWGDSHAGQLKPVLAAISAQRDSAGLMRFRAACPPLPGFRFEPERESCEAFNRDVLADLRERPGVDTVIIAARWIGYLAEPEARPAMARALDIAVTQAEAGGRRVVLVAAGADFPWPVPVCIMRRGDASCDLSRQAAEGRRAAAQAVFAEVARKHPRVRIVDPMNVLCGDTRCPVVRDGGVLYSDGHHLSPLGTSYLVPSFQRATQTPPIGTDAIHMRSLP